MKALVAGGTGLIGKFLLEQLQRDPNFTEVIALTRRPKTSQDEKTRWLEVDFDEPIRLETSLDCAFCCLGTTIKKAGSQEAFRKVDFEYVLNTARAAKAAGCKKFLVVSAIGSDPESRVFYNRVKGEMEAGIRAFNFEYTAVFHPSILLGNREEKRLGERIGIAVGKVVAPLLLGSLRKYRPIHARQVATAMRHYASQPSNIGLVDLHYDDMQLG